MEVWVNEDTKLWHNTDDYTMDFLSIIKLIRASAACNTLQIIIYCNTIRGVGLTCENMGEFSWHLLIQVWSCEGEHTLALQQSSLIPL